MLDPRMDRYGSLACTIVDSGDNPEFVVVMCHGYGAPGHDLVGLAPEWARLIGDHVPAIRFVFPAAPHTLEDLGMPTGRAWWPLNMARLQALFQTQRFEELHGEEPPGMSDSRDMLCETIEAVKSEFGGEQTPLVLGGFSQGAMLSMDAATQGTIAPPEGLILFSGTVVCEAQWQAKMPRLAKTQVYQSHGTIDQILPYTSATRLDNLLREAKINTEFHSFEGPHTIDPESIAKTAMLISAVASRKP